MERWSPKRETTRQEEFLLKRLHRTRKLFGFLRRHRHELFDDGFQAELEAMYRSTGAGEEPARPENPVGTSNRARGESRDEADAVGGGSEPSVSAPEDELSTRRGGPGREVEVVALAAAAQAARRS